MHTLLLDCYTDEAAGLGVPPYLGTYPRYLFGELLLKKQQVTYATIDDLRFFVRGEKKSEKTDITVYNRVCRQFEKALRSADALLIVVGVQVPGKYLSAMPGTLHELGRLIPQIQFKGEVIITGPGVYGTQLHGGRVQERRITAFEHTIRPYQFTYKALQESALIGTKILRQIGDIRVIELETSKGCQTKPGCSFCTEPLKSRLEFRDTDDIISEAKALYDAGARYMRLGKHACFYAHSDAIRIVKEIRAYGKELKVLHIDNVNPVNVITKRGEEITKAIVQYCTPGNIAPFGVESFDPVVGMKNKLNTKPEVAYEAIKIINKYGAQRGENGMHEFLPGINILFGLAGESKKTHEENMKWLRRIRDEGLLLRRINVRQTAVIEGTELASTVGTKFLRKNKGLYWKWRRDIREEIDNQMLQRILPVGTEITDVRMEVRDGKNTFGRQLGTYPLVVGVKKRLEIGKFYRVKVKKHLLRSIEAEV